LWRPHVAVEPNKKRNRPNSRVTPNAIESVRDVVAESSSFSLQSWHQFYHRPGGFYGKSTPKLFQYPLDAASICAITTQIIGKNSDSFRRLRIAATSVLHGQMGSIREGHIYFLFFFHPKNGKQNTWKRNEPICGHLPSLCSGQANIVIIGKDIQTPFNDNSRQNMIPKPASVTYWIYNAAFNGL
jgi:hypothetical protein